MRKIGAQIKSRRCYISTWYCRGLQVWVGADLVIILWGTFRSSTAQEYRLRVSDGGKRAECRILELRLVSSREKEKVS